MCRVCGKQMKHYLENKTTREFLAELSSVVGIPTTDLGDGILCLYATCNKLSGTLNHRDPVSNDSVGSKIVLLSGFPFSPAKFTFKKVLPSRVAMSDLSTNNETELPPRLIWTATSLLNIPSVTEQGIRTI